MELKILSEYIEMMTELKIDVKKDLDFSTTCDDKISVAYNKGVINGISKAIEILNGMLDRELETMAVNMEGEKR